ncbi:hypothetical protein ZPAH1_orf00154 [Aeromonas phage ZPAH1]|nr:hypothetical protein ZPAH1_orf00154 [Aeromonas phage ZPAH1]
MKTILLLILMSFPLCAEVLDTDRVWREHVISDKAANKTLHLVGYLPHPDKEHDIDIPYMLHVGAIQRNKAFYMNITVMKNEFHPKEQIIMYVQDEKYSYTAQNSNTRSVPDTIRNSDASVALKLFDYSELNTCSGRYKQLVEASYVSIQYVTPALHPKTIVVDLKGLNKTMQVVYGIPNTCK